MIRALHFFLIAALVLQAAYCSYEVLVVLAPEGGSGPLMARAGTVPFELLVARRLYAIEGWIAFGTLCLYLAITEVVPRRSRPG